MSVDHPIVVLSKDECNPNPCANSGTCTDYYDGYSCDCVDGYEGDQCQTGETNNG